MMTSPRYLFLSYIALVIQSTYYVQAFLPSSRIPLFDQHNAADALLDQNQNQMKQVVIQKIIPQTKIVVRNNRHRSNSPFSLSRSSSSSSNNNTSTSSTPTTTTITLTNYNNDSQQQQQQQQQKQSTITIQSRKIDATTSNMPNNKDEVMMLASFRNNLTSPEMLIERQIAKRESFDRVASAKKGVAIGLGIGIVVTLFLFVNGLTTDVGVDSGGESTRTVLDALSNSFPTGASVGGLTAILLGINNYMGKNVYVMGLKEARNRLTVDYSAGIQCGQDVGFASFLVANKDKTDGDGGSDRDHIQTIMNGRFVGCGGIVGCIDCQLRNSKINTSKKLIQAREERMGTTTSDDTTASTPTSTSSSSSSSSSIIQTRTIPGLPSHLHLKNMEVDVEMRRMGVARSLMDAVETWAREKTDAEMLTLEVENSNEGAIRLYRSCGFVKDEDSGEKISPGSFGTQTRSFMVKYL